MAVSSTNGKTLDSSSDENEATEKEISNNNYLTFRNGLFFLKMYFIFVAILQGIGVLGLPNSLHRSGIQPMIVTTAFSFILEVMVSYTYLIITQKAIAIKYFHKESQNILDDESESEEIVLDDKQREKIDKNKNVNSHLLSALFLPKYLRITFDLIMFLEL
ncbi:uncharacterized protein TRIADDRAFT_51589 [Trichoplax adhaerens]|uniref:Uncharacterized protein n=1 Tax=Trichoplax adhaerens TaxID=10228 RepID=B3RK15_TRIAD|nr:predicted protein [Trichoplax adhaerens]EDV29357.1 predicted protein [Trichoplax adhaerens]|eukprot:XP_002108559.1 predicted protein [Trichoplax adhaerens]